MGYSAPAEAPQPVAPAAVPDRRSTAPLTEVEQALWDDLCRRDRPRWYRRRGRQAVSAAPAGPP